MPIGVYEVNIDQATNDRAQLGQEQIKRNPNIVQQQTADSEASLTSDIFKAGKSLVSYTNPFWGLYRTQKGEDISFGAAFKDRTFTSNLGYLSASLMGAMDDMSRAAYNTSSFLLNVQGDVWEGANQYTDQPAKWLSDKALSIPQIKVNTNDVLGATQLLGDVSRTFIPFMIPAVGLATGSITMASNTYTESIHSGMDKETAQSRAFLAGATGVGMGLVAPLTGKQIVGLLAGESGAITTAAGMGAFNVGLGITQRAADWQMVKQKYPEMADKMEVLSAKTVGLDIALWAMFAGYGYSKVRKTLIESGVPVSEVTKTVRAAEEVIGADTAVQDAVFVRRQNKSINDDGPIDSPEAYAAHEAMINDAEARIENAEPMPMDVPESVPLKPVEPVSPAKEGGRIVTAEKPVKKPSVAPDSILSFTDSIGIGRDRIVVHDANNPMPDHILKAAEAEGGNPDSIEAWIGDDGILHVNADGVKNMDAVKDVIVFHEMTHAGQDKAVVEKAIQAIETATGTYADAVRQLRDQIAANRNYDMNTVEGRTKATREATAKIMEDVLGRKQVAEAAQDGYLSQLVTAFKEALRSLGINVKYSEKDIFRLIGKMWKQGQERMGVKLSTEAVQPMAEQTPRYTQEQAIADAEATKALDQASSNVKNVDFALAWHGTPHKFDKFSTSAIGTGEGAQAYGYGLYFAGNKEVAEWYRENLAQRKPRSQRITIDGKLAQDYDNAPNGLPMAKAMEALELAATVKGAINYVEYANYGDGKGVEKVREKALEFLKSLPTNSKIEIADQDKGSLYKVELSPAEDEYLLWDKPLSEQSEKVKDALENNINISKWEVRPVGEKFGIYQVYDAKLDKKIDWLDGTYDTLAEAKAAARIAQDESISGKGAYLQKSYILGSDKAASEYLHSLGIRGIKYLDGNSRSGKKEDYNYVIFSDDDVNIMGKEGVDFSIRPDMDANTRINKLSELVGKDAQGNDILSAEDLIQVVGTVETRYAHITKMMTQSTVDIIDEYKRMGLGPYMKETKEQLLAMTDAERMWALTKGELLKTLGDKKETIRRQKIQAEKLQEREADYDRMLTENPDRPLGSERLIDMLMGDPTGRGVVMPWKNKADGINHEYMATLASGIKEFESWLGLKMTAEQEVNLVKELFEPGSSNDQSMRKAAEQVRVVFDAMRERMNKAGADIGYIKGYMPQTWDGDKILRFGLNTGDILLGSVRKRKQADMIAESKTRWVDFMMERIDRQNARYIDETTGSYYDDVQMREFLGAAFDTMSSGGMNKGVASGSPKQSGLSTRLGYERQLFFKSPEAWIEANRAFGSQDALSSIVSHVERGSKDLALLEMFGPNPNRVMDELINKAYNNDFNTSYHWQRKLNYVKALWMEIAGNRPTQNSFMSHAAANTRKALVFSKLGSALISQIGDLPIYRAMAMNNGFGLFDQVMSLYKGFDPRKKTSRELADTLEFGVTAMQDSVMSRFMDSTNGNDTMSKVAQFTMRAGGMQAWASNMSLSAKLLLSRGLYHMSKYEYKDLSADNKALLRRSGITPDEWNNSLRGNTHIAMTADGKELYAPHLIEDIGLREKVWGMVERESTFLALRPDESTQALIKGQAARGSAGFELKSSMALFRSFTAAMIQKVYPRMASMNPGTSRSAWVWQNGSTYLFAILAGALQMQLKAIAKGEEPKPMDDWRFWGAASIQALNLGVIGDLAYGDYNRFGQSPTATVAGPVAGIIDDTLKLTQGNLVQASKGEETDFAAESIKYAKSYLTPNLWYMKPFLNQWLWYPLQEWASPGYLQRHQDRVEREQGTKFWLPPTGAAQW